MSERTDLASRVFRDAIPPMAERDRSKVTITLTEADARALLAVLDGMMFSAGTRIAVEIKHALAECDCAGEVGR